MVPPVKFLLVGSALTKEEPRDLDVVGVLSDEEFLKRYGYNHQEFMKAVNMPEQPLSIKMWKRDCKLTGMVLSNMFDRFVDFRFLTESMTYGHIRDIELKFDWRELID